METKNTINENIEKATEEFFKILISKDFAYKDEFRDYLKTFLDDEGNFDEGEFESKVEEIFEFISEHNATDPKPGNFEKIDSESMTNIITENKMSYAGYPKFTEELLTYIESGEFNMEFDIGIIQDDIDIVRNGIYEYLENYYNEEFFHKSVQTTIEEVADEIIKVLKYKKN